jgi:type I restriction enzyme S subunit
MVLPIAPLVEQTEIAARMDATSARIRQEEASATKMRALKSGLMDDLLTGRVRVTPLLA